MNAEASKLRQKLLESLSAQGFSVKNGRITPPCSRDKDKIRKLYVHLRNERLRENRDWILSVEERIMRHFASGFEVNVKRILPRLRIVEKKWERDLFRYATLQWSIPVSQGFGRRMRFLVFDEHNGKLMGLFALCDPVYNLRARDQWIQWNVDDKRERLYHVMDAYVLGAVPPYSYLLGGKLIALLAASNEVRETFREKYAGQESVIRQVVREPHLVLITTTSALGRSSIYNRLSMNGRKVYISKGFTQGWGHFHFSNGTFSQVKDYLSQRGDPIVKKYKYGGGPNWRFRVVKHCLKELDLPTDFLRHGIKREVFVVPLASNARKFLRGEESEPDYYDMPMGEIFHFFQERWLLPRSQRDRRYKEFEKENLRLSRKLDQVGAEEGS